MFTIKERKTGPWKSLKGRKEFPDLRATLGDSQEYQEPVFQGKTHVTSASLSDGRNYRNSAVSLMGKQTRPRNPTGGIEFA